MSGVDGSGAGVRSRSRTAAALVRSLRAELADGLRAVAWYGDGDGGLLYVHGGVERPDRLGAAVGRRQRTPREASIGTESFEYAIDAYEEVLVVTLSARVLVRPAGDDAGVALSVERDGTPLPALTAAIERAIATYRRER